MEAPERSRRAGGRLHVHICSSFHSVRSLPNPCRRCDEYFQIAHRGETRGLGGIFFDDLRDRWGGDCRLWVVALRAAGGPHLRAASGPCAVGWGQRGTAPF